VLSCCSLFQDTQSFHYSSLKYTQPEALDGFPTGTNGLPYALLDSGTQKSNHIQVELEVILCTFYGLLIDLPTAYGGPMDSKWNSNSERKEEY
jgi:hypothetical protein